MEQQCRAAPPDSPVPEPAPKAAVYQPGNLPARALPRALHGFGKATESLHWLCWRGSGFPCYALGLILSKWHVGYSKWGFTSLRRRDAEEIRRRVSLAAHSCWAKLFVVYCVWSSSEVGEGHNIPTAILPQWRSGILLGPLILCVYWASRSVEIWRLDL